MGFAIEAKTEWKVGGHILQPHSLETGDKCLPPPRTQVSEFGLGLGGGTKVLYPPGPDYRRLKSHHL